MKQLNEYLIDSLLDAIDDSDPDVKKTAILGVPKVYEISPKLIESRGLISLMNKMLDKEKNAHVIASIVTALSELSAFKYKESLTHSYFLCA